MAAYVELNRVSYRYPGAARTLKEIDLTIPAGESTAVFGASGSGKSTLAYLFNGLIPHFFGGLLEGTVVVAGNPTRNTMVSELFSHVGLVLQNTDAQLFNATVADDIAFGLESLGYPAIDIRKRTHRISDALGITHLLHRSPETLSGGEKRLAAIATVLCLDPALLVLDEPFAGLDHRGTRIVRDLLRQNQRHGKNLILIEHRTKPFFTEADRCIIIDQGAVSFDGKPAEASGVLLDSHLMPRYPERRIRTRSRSDEPVLVIKDLSCRIEGRDVLSDISLSLTRGEAVAIVGENGAGKTTLIKHFNGLYQPTTGEVSFKGRCIRSLHPSARAVAVGVCFQNPNDQFFEADVRKEILAGPKRLGKYDRKWFEQICDTLCLHLLLDRSPYRLSEGEKRRVALASILVMRPEVLVLDEPTAGQDGRFKEILVHICGSISAMGTAMVVVTHDLDFARASADRWVVMHAGRIAGDGAPEEMREKHFSILDNATDRPLRSVAGSYKPIESGWIMANLDPRTRLAFLAAAVGAVLVTRRPETLAAESLLLLGGVVLLKADRRLGHLRHLFGPMIALVFVTGLVFFDLQTALTLAARLFNLLAVSFVCFQTIDPEEMAGALRKLGIPFGLVFILSAGMRYVPLIGRKIRNILDAQQARGIDLRPRIKNISNFAALLTPLVVQAFVLSDELALAMESRGFGCKIRSSRRTYRLRPIDYILMGASLGGLCLLAWWEKG